jgi:hypothetical protein
MKHAGPQALEALADLLAVIRTRGLREPRPGVFYRKSKAMIHFHEDKAGLFADIRVGAEWQRICVSEADGRSALLEMIDRR